MKQAGSRSHSTPEGWHTVTPRIVVHDAERLVEFLRQVFGATGDYRPERPSVIKIGDSIVMVSDAGIRIPMPAFLYVYVDDTDRTYRRALQAGASSLEEPSDTPYGDRRGMVRDEWGNTWQIATHGGDRDAVQPSRYYDQDGPRMNHTQEQIAEFKRVFSARRRRQLFVALPILLLGIGVATMRASGRSDFLGLPGSAVGPAFIVLVVAVLGFSFSNWRCPACNKYLGKDIGPKYCEKCGAPLQ